MIELTDAQVQAVAASKESPPTIVDPTTKMTYVLIRSELYDQLTDDWTGEERDRLREEAVEMLDNYGKKP